MNIQNILIKNSISELRKKLKIGIQEAISISAGALKFSTSATLCHFFAQ